MSAAQKQALERLSGAAHDAIIASTCAPELPWLMDIARRVDGLLDAEEEREEAA